MKKKLQFLLICVILLASLCLFAGNDVLKPVKTIGDERDDYTFFRIFGAVMSPGDDIFISDGKGHFVAKYDSRGNFKKRIGQKGQGPGDFNFPRSLEIFNNKLFVYDGGNCRVVEMDMDLNVVRITEPGFNNEVRFSNNFFVINENRFLGDLMYLKKITGTVAIIDRKGNLIEMFFKKLPVELKLKKFDNMSVHYYAGARSIARKSIAVDRNSKTVFISFKRPDNPIEFFVYDFDGKLKKSFLYHLEKKYTFPYHLLKTPGEYPSKSYEFGVDSVFIYKGNYIVYLTHFWRKKKVSYKYIEKVLVFGSDGKLRHEQVMDERYRFFYVSSEGYVLGKNFDADIEKLYIFKIEI